MTTDWIYIAILSAVALGTVNVVDSHLLSQRMPSLKSFLLPVGIIYIMIGVVFIFIYPLQQTDLLHMSTAVISALLRAAALTLMLDFFTKEEVAVIIPVVVNKRRPRLVHFGALLRRAIEFRSRCRVEHVSTRYQLPALEIRDLGE